MDRREKMRGYVISAATWVIITGLMIGTSTAESTPAIEEEYKKAVLECLENGEAVCKKAEKIASDSGISDSQREQWDREVVPKKKYMMAIEACRKAKDKKCEQAARVAYWHKISEDNIKDWVVEPPDAGAEAGAHKYLEQGFVSIKMAKANMGNKAVFDESIDNAIMEFSLALEKTSNTRIQGKAYEMRGAAYMIQKKLNKALEDLKKATELQPRSPSAYYNLASLYSLRNEIDLCLDAIDKALENGFNKYRALKTDPDLANLRKNPEFKRILEKHKIP